MNPLEFSVAYCQWSSLPIHAAWVSSHQASLRSTASAFFEQHGFPMRPANLVKEVTSQLQPDERKAKQRKKSQASSGEVALSKMPDLSARPVGAHALQWEGSDGKLFSSKNAILVDLFENYFDNETLSPSHSHLSPLTPHISPSHLSLSRSHPLTLAGSLFRMTLILRYSSSTPPSNIPSSDAAEMEPGGV